MKEPFQQTKYFITKTDPAELPASAVEIAMVGRSNVGKSSLINAICQNNKLARVSNMPGRTRGVNVYDVVRGKWLVDLPGYGYAVGPKRQRDYFPKMIGLYLSGRASLSLVLLLLDAEVGVSPVDMSMFEWLKEKNIPVRIVGTKVDRLAPTKQLEARTRLASSLGLLPQDVAWVSAKKGYGISPLKQELKEMLSL
jgi:GTP-binding protein